MQTGNQDIYALIPAYPGNHLALVTPSTDPCPQVPEFKCPERDRIFHQVGPWKRYIRKFHQIPCLNEDLFDPLRDIFGDKAICRHYNKQFIDLYRLKYHINVRICLSFDMTKDSIVPIAARPSLCMHLHYKSIPSILFDKALVCNSSPLCVLSFSRSCSIDSQALWRTASRIIGL